LIWIVPAKTEPPAANGCPASWVESATRPGLVAAASLVPRVGPLVLAIPELHQQRVDVGHSNREQDVQAVDLQGEPAVRDEPAHQRALGPVEMGAAPPQLDPGFGLDLVGIG
jgi:hypothetical protein